MSLSDRRLFLIGLAALAGCGFTPAYGPGGAGAALQGKVRIAEPSDRNGFDLVQRLEDRLGRASAPRYLLDFTITTDRIGVGITPDNAITRYDLTGKVDWVLTDMAGTRITGGTAQGFAGYSATGSTVAGLAAEDDAGVRLKRNLADQIVTQLIATPGLAP